MQIRNIAFKAKRKDNGEWVEGSLIITEGSVAYIIRSKSKAFIPKGKNIICSAECYEINIETLCQCTGLTDKNGKKIWENDIIELPGEDGYFVCEWQEDTARFVLNGEGLTVDFDNYWSYEVEVIGNIFDNPDLLEVE